MIVVNGMPPRHSRRPRGRFCRGHHSPSVCLLAHPPNSHTNVRGVLDDVVRRRVSDVMHQMASLARIPLHHRNDNDEDQEHEACHMAPGGSLSRSGPPTIRWDWNYAIEKAFGFFGENRQWLVFLIASLQLLSSSSAHATRSSHFARLCQH